VEREFIEETLNTEEEKDSKVLFILDLVKNLKNAQRKELAKKQLSFEI